MLIFTFNFHANMGRIFTNYQLFISTLFDTVLQQTQETQATTAIQGFL